MEQKDNITNKRSRRSKIRVERDILDAVGRLVKKEGFAKVTLPAVAHEAAIDISVIYRNFGSLEELLDRYSHKFDYWLNDLIDSKKNMDTNVEEETLLRTIAERFVKALTTNKEIQQLMVWELSVDNKSTRRSAQNRDLAIEEELPFYDAYLSHLDMNARSVFGILTAGMYYIILRNKRSTFVSIDYSTKQGKEILVDSLVKITLLLRDANKEKERLIEVATKLKNQNVDSNIIADATGITLDIINNL